MHATFLDDECLQFAQQNGDIPTVTQNTFTTGWCPEIKLPSGREADYKNCQVDNVYRNNIQNGSMEEVSKTMFTLDRSYGMNKTCLKVYAYLLMTVKGILSQ